MVSQAQNLGQCLRKRTIVPFTLSTPFTNGLNIYRTFQRTSSLILLAGIVLLTCIGTTPEAHSAIYYLSPNGTNSNFTGSSDKPWQTFDFAIPKLQPNDTLILKNGTYNNLNSGGVFIDCSRNAKNGTSISPITIKAENERQAFLNGNGSYPPFTIINCSNWKIEGLRAKSVDNKNSADGRGDVFVIKNSSNLKFTRLLLTHNNRYVNSHLLSITFSNNVLVEESEFYSFHRHAIRLHQTNNNIFRRNYFNSRGHQDLVGGFPSASTQRGDVGISIYPGSNNILENNISEGNSSIADIQATAASEKNKFFGNISIRDHYGVYLAARGSGNKMPLDTLFENLVVVDPTFIGIYARGTKNTLINNSSFFGGSKGLVADYEKNYPGDGMHSIFTKNTLVSNSGIYGFQVINHSEFSHKFAGIYKPKTNFWPNYNYFNESTDNPNLGACKVFIPQNSPLKRKGEGGVDIGANILYRYEKGVLTNQRLWNATTGAFPHGALVGGVNDIAGSSAFDVHKRLNVNANGCTLP